MGCATRPFRNGVGATAHQRSSRWSVASCRTYADVCNSDCGIHRYTAGNYVRALTVYKQASKQTNTHTHARAHTHTKQTNKHNSHTPSGD